MRRLDLSSRLAQARTLRHGVIRLDAKQPDALLVRYRNAFDPIRTGGGEVGRAGGSEERNEGASDKIEGPRSEFGFGQEYLITTELPLRSGSCVTPLHVLLLVPSDTEMTAEQHLPAAPQHPAVTHYFFRERGTFALCVVFKVQSDIRSNVFDASGCVRGELKT